MFFNNNEELIKIKFLEADFITGRTMKIGLAQNYIEYRNLLYFLCKRNPKILKLMIKTDGIITAKTTVKNVFEVLLYHEYKDSFYKDTRWIDDNHFYNYLLPKIEKYALK